MIIDMLFKSVVQQYNKTHTLPQYIHVRRQTFHHDYHLSVIVALASRICGNKRSIGIHNTKNVIGVLIKAINVMKNERAKTAEFISKDFTVIKELDSSILKIVDLRPTSLNCGGDAAVRLEAAMNRNKDGVILTPAHRKAAAILAQSTDVFIVETDEQSINLQDFLARANLHTIVLTSAAVEGFYTADTSEHVTHRIIAN